MSEGWDYTPTHKLRFVEREWHADGDGPLLKPYSAPDFGRGYVLQQWWRNDWVAKPGEPPLPEGEWRDVQLEKF